MGFNPDPILKVEDQAALKTYRREIAIT